MSRIEFFKQMLAQDSSNTAVLFGLANEYQKARDWQNAIAALEEYLSKTDDEGAAWGMLARAYLQTGAREKAKHAYQKGIAAANRHGHPSLAADFAEVLEFDLAD
jgi:predicted Zn-dependent protease